MEKPISCQISDLIDYISGIDELKNVFSKKEITEIRHLQQEIKNVENKIVKYVY